MVSKPLQDLLASDLKSCRETGISIKESRIKVSTEKHTGENFIFFHTDSGEGRKCLRMDAEGIRICDYLIYYTKESGKDEVVCFLEVKGTDLKVAAEQVKTTHKHLTDLLKEKLPFTYFTTNVVLKICICLHGQAPSTSQRFHDELKQKYGKGNVEIKHGTSRYEIGAFLRRGTN